VAAVASVPEGKHSSLATHLTIAAWALMGLICSLTAWTLASPLGSGPDEPSHMIQAAATVRGEVAGPSARVPFGALFKVTVPRWTAQAAVLPNCFAFRPDHPAGCSPPVSTSGSPTPSTTQFGNYPPLYYALVGLPSLGIPGSRGLYAMRAVGVVVDSCLLALGLFVLVRYGRSRLRPLGALVALTPMVLFVTSVVNDSGIEVAAAFAAWCALVTMADGVQIPRALGWWAALAVGLLMVSRPASLLDAALLALVIAAYAGWRRTTAIVADRAARPVLGMGVLGGVVAIAWLLVVGSPTLLGYPLRPQRNLGGSVALVVGESGGRLRQLIGDFGWLDTAVPLRDVVVWATIVGVLVVVGLLRSSGVRRGVPLLLVGTFAMSLAIETPRVNAVGPFWQGRYWLPLAVGVPLLACAPIATNFRGRHSRRRPRWPSVALVVAVGTVLALVQIDALATALRRYEVGLGSPTGAETHWAPPGGDALVLSLAIVGQAALVSLVAWSIWRRPQRHASGCDLSDLALGDPGPPEGSGTSVGPEVASGVHETRPGGLSGLTWANLW